MIPLTRRHRLERIYRDYQEDQQFEHFRRPGINFVPGHGDLRPQLVLVGEAPGKNENDGGEPFIGAAGRVLDDLLDSVGIDRSDIFITNTVKYRPKSNRTPTPQEVQASRPYLDRELNVLTPRVVGLMGNAAISAYFGDVRVGNAHGRTVSHRLGNGGYVTMVALYHPAFGIYQRRNLDWLYADMKIVQQHLEEQDRRFL